MLADSMGKEFEQVSRGMAYLHYIISEAIAGETKRNTSDAVWLGVGIICRYLDWDDWKTGLSWVIDWITYTSLCSLSYYSMTPGSQEGSSHEKASENEHSKRPKQKLAGLLGLNLRIHIASLSFYSIGQSNYKHV